MLTLRVTNAYIIFLNGEFFSKKEIENFLQRWNRRAVSKREYFDIGDFFRKKNIYSFFGGKYFSKWELTICLQGSINN